MLFRKYLLLIAGLAALLVFAGCGDKTPNIDAQKKTLNTYLEAIRDHDKAKMDKVTHRDELERVKDPDYQKSFAEFDQNTGKLLSWTYTEEKPFVDELNGQTIFQVKLVTSKKKYNLDFDLRKDGDRWFIGGVKQAETAKPDLSSDPFKKK